MERQDDKDRQGKLADRATRGHAMTDDSEHPEQARGSHNRGSGGRDSRFSKLIGWAWVMLGGAAVSGIWIGSNNLYQLNVTVARIADNNVVVAKKLEDHEARLRQMEREVATWNGKNLRGGPEVHRGR